MFCDLCFLSLLCIYPCSVMFVFSLLYVFLCAVIFIFFFSIYMYLYCVIFVFILSIYLSVLFNLCSSLCYTYNAYLLCLCCQCSLAFYKNRLFQKIKCLIATSSIIVKRKFFPSVNFCENSHFKTLIYRH